MIVGWFVGLGWLVAVVYLIVVRRKMGPVRQGPPGATGAPPGVPG